MQNFKKRFNTHRLSMGLTVLPFIFAGWIFASWLASSAFAAGERGSIVLVDPPQEFYEVAHRLGFKVTGATELKELEMKIVTVRIPRGHYPYSAALLLRHSLPDLVMDGSNISTYKYFR